MYSKGIKQLLIVISSLLAHFILPAQTKYSTDKNYILSKSNGENLLGKDFHSAYPDTSATNLHNYTPRNYSGNLGLPQPAYLLQYQQRDLGFHYYQMPFGSSVISPQQVNYYVSKGPFASLSGFAGSKQEQTFRLLFSHTTKKNLNITVKFNRFGSLGFYNKQQTFVNNFYSSTHYTNAKKRFGFYSYFLYNKVKNQENGGVKYDTLIEENVLIGKDLLEVNLSNAKRENKTADFNFNPWFRLNKRDSIKISHYIDYKFNYTGNYYWYLDNGIGYENFYNTVYLDTIQTNDSTHLRKFNNRINYTFKLNKAGLSASIGYSNEYAVLHQFFDSIFQNNLAHVSLNFNKTIKHKDSTAFNRNKKINSELNYSSIVSGVYQSDYKAEWISSLTLRADDNGHATNKSIHLFLKIASELRHPDFLYNYNYSNNFRWNNSFKQTGLFQTKLGFKNEISGLGLSILWQNTTNLIYMDSTMLPKQANVVISNWSYNLNFSKVLFKHLGIGANLTYQTTNKESIVRIAPLRALGSLYYTGNLFKNNLQLQIGVQAEYFTSFKAYAYMPAYNMYYLQNRKSVGEYPFLDVFLNARIRPVQFFVKVENALYGLMGSNYNFLPGYYQPDRAFRFGLTWLFFD